MPTKFEITTKTVIYTLLLVVGGWLIIQIRDILALLFIAFIIMAAMRPIVDRLEHLRLPRIFAILLVYGLIISLTVWFGSLVLPPLIFQSIKLVTHLPEYFKQAAPFINTNLDSVIGQFAPLGQNLARVTLSVFSNIVTIFTVAVFAFYFLLERKNLHNLTAAFVGKEIGDRMVEIVRKAENRLGEWVRGEMLLAAIIGLASFLGLTLLNVNYALPLALIAGVLEVIPIIGPIISAIPAVLVALTVSPELAVVVALLYFIIQQLENNLIVPQVMHKAVGVPPLASLLALMVGGRLGGIVGIILAVPVLLVLQTVIQDVLTSSSRSVKGR